MSLPLVTQAKLQLIGDSKTIDLAVKQQTSIGESHFTLDRKILSELEASIVIVQRHCGVCALDGSGLDEYFDEQDFRLVYFEPSTFRDVLKAVLDLSMKLDVLSQGMELLSDVELQIVHLQSRIEFDSKKSPPRKSVVMVEWIDPVFVAGNWIPEMISLVGGDPILFGDTGRSCEVSFDQLSESKPEVVLVAPCDFSVEQSRSEIMTGRDKLRWKNLDARQGVFLFVADGAKYFNMPGPNLLRSIELLAITINPEYFEKTGSYSREEMIQLQF